MKEKKDDLKNNVKGDNKNKNKKIKIIITALLLTLLVAAVIITIVIVSSKNSDNDDYDNYEINNTTNKEKNSKEKNIVSDVEYFIGSSDKTNFKASKVENEKYVVSFDYNKDIMLLHVCAADSQTFISRLISKSFESSNLIESIIMNCKENGTLKYKVEINNYTSLTEQNLEENTILMDSEGNNLNKTVTQVKNDYVNEFKDKCKTYDYKTIYRYAEDYKGKEVKYTGKVVQVIDDGDVSSYRVNITKDRWGYYDDTVYVIYANLDNSTPRILEDDIITMYGTLGDLFSYETVMGSKLTIPSITARYIEINK